MISALLSAQKVTFRTPVEQLVNWFVVLMNFVTASIPSASALREDGLPLQGPKPVAISVFPSFRTHPQLMLSFLTLPSDTAINSVDVSKMEMTSVMLL